MILLDCQARATGVLSAIQCIGWRFVSENLIVHPYVNGREYGWSLSHEGSNRCVVFSEYRRTDQIVVYKGRMGDFSTQGNVPSDDVYELKVFFEPFDFEGAARHILDYLKG